MAGTSTPEPAKSIITARCMVCSSYARSVRAGTVTSGSVHVGVVRQAPDEGVEHALDVAGVLVELVQQELLAVVGAVPVVGQTPCCVDDDRHRAQEPVCHHCCPLLMIHSPPPPVVPPGIRAATRLFRRAARRLCRRP